MVRRKTKAGCSPTAYAKQLADALGQAEAEAFALERWETAKIPYWVEVYAELVAPPKLKGDWRHRGPYPHKTAPRLWKTYGGKKRHHLMCSWCGRNVGAPPMIDDETGKLVDCPLCPAKPWRTIGIVDDDDD